MLASKVRDDVGSEPAVVLALPRGGVPVAAEIAEALNAPLDVLVVRKLGVPGHEELAMGAIASGGIISLDNELINLLHLRQEEVRAVVAAESRELERREELYRNHRAFPDVAGRCVILVDDGLATGQSMAVAIEAVKRLHPKRIIVAVPVVTTEALEQIRQDAEVVYLLNPEPFYAVGFWYQDFSQVSDDEVRALLEQAATRR